jgi:histidine ammonia-lyase
LITIDGNSLTIEQVIQVARNKEKVEIHKNNKHWVDKNAAVVEDFMREIRLLLK